MRISVFSTKPYDQEFLSKANADFGDRHTLSFFEVPLNTNTVRLTEGNACVCPFVNDTLNADVLRDIYGYGVRFVALRCAGFNNVDLGAAEELGIRVARVPAYSPSSVAEHTVGLMLTLCRKIHKAYNRTREGNFSLGGLLGFDFIGKTIGIIGTGKIGQRTAKIMHGFGCRVLAFDKYEDEALKALGVKYVSMDEIFAESDVISLHCPLMSETRHLINADSLKKMKDGVMIINTSRGALLDTDAAIEALKQGKIGSLGLDVYEEEEHFFFEDFSDRVIQDDTLARVLLFPNVVVTAHQAFFTKEALLSISQTTLENINAFENGLPAPGLVCKT